jgi:hypothetical protein
VAWCFGMSRYNRSGLLPHGFNHVVASLFELPFDIVVSIPGRPTCQVVRSASVVFVAPVDVGVPRAYVICLACSARFLQQGCGKGETETKKGGRRKLATAKFGSSRT